MTKFLDFSKSHIGKTVTFTILGFLFASSISQIKFIVDMKKQLDAAEAEAQNSDLKVPIKNLDNLLREMRLNMKLERNLSKRHDIILGSIRKYKKNNNIDSTIYYYNGLIDNQSSIVEDRGIVKLLIQNYPSDKYKMMDNNLTAESEMINDFILFFNGEIKENPVTTERISNYASLQTTLTSFQINDDSFKRIIDEQSIVVDQINKSNSKIYEKIKELRTSKSRNLAILFFYFSIFILLCFISFKAGYLKDHP